MSLADLADWMAGCDRPGTVWYLKRLAANDTLASGSHQGGPYFPKELLFELYPDLHRPAILNPDVRIATQIASHGGQRDLRAVWYNNALHGQSRNEARITQWGGSSSPVLDPDSTGALVLFAFLPALRSEERALSVWICRTVAEEDLAEERFGEVVAGTPLVIRHGEAPVRAGRPEGADSPCRLEPAQIPAQWLAQFPGGAEIVQRVCELRTLAGKSPDLRLVRRRECEFELFQSVESAVEAGLIGHGFASLGEFLQHAQRILQRRKARSGLSLELQTRQILVEEGLVEHRGFEHGVESEPGHRPDFLFPTQASYRDPSFPVRRLRMLAAKTTCRDRWRQILNEAGRIPLRHLLTLQEGVSEGQFAEMQAAGVQLVVPASLVESYPQAIRPHLQTLGAFITEVRELQDLPRR